jgi:hypothetical protein
MLAPAPLAVYSDDRKRGRRAQGPPVAQSRPQAIPFGVRARLPGAGDYRGGSAMTPRAVVSIRAASPTTASANATIFA